MTHSEDIGSFFKENKKLVKDYLDTKWELYKLKLIGHFAKSAGYFLWLIISIFLFFLLMVFLGLFTGFWLSDLTGSYIKGFGLTAAIMLVVIIIIAWLRKALFVNPIIRLTIKHLSVDKKAEKADNAD